MKSTKPVGLAVMVILGLLLTQACSSPPQPTQNQDVPLTALPAATDAPEATVVEQPAERIQLDPCSMLTAEEVGQVLTGPVEIQPSIGTGGCVYVLQSEDPGLTVQLALSAAQGLEAKALTMLSLGMLAGFSGDPEIQAKFEQVNDQLAELSLAEVVARTAELFRGTGVNLTMADGPGEHATWLVVENEFYSQGTLIMVRGDEYVSLTQIGGDVEGAFERLGDLGATVFDRLPVSFYLLDEDGDGSFTFGLSEDEEPAAARVPTATLPPTSDCVPELLSPGETEMMDNGCLSKTDPIVWDFQWSGCPAAQSYGLFVIGANATVPVMDITTTGTSFRYESSGYIADQNRLQWRWKVRAMQDDGWGEWTPEGMFDVEPVGTDCGTGAGG
jgi:hypothetical protein